MRADRLLDIVGLLRRHRRLTAAELANRLGVSRRTVLRDLDVLSASGVPVYAEHGRGGGYCLLPGYRPQTSDLTVAESTALFLPGGETAADALGRGHAFRSARRKLEAALSGEAARDIGELSSWLLVVPEGWGEPLEPPSAIRSLAAAASRREVIELSYASPGRSPDVRRARPLGVVLAGQVWYLLAQRHESGVLRTYRIDRVKTVVATGEHFRPEYSLADAWRQARESFQSRDSVSVALVTTSAAWPIVASIVSLVGRTIHVIERDNIVEVSARVYDLDHAASVLAGAGHLAEITKPGVLIDKVLALSQQNLNRYGETSPTALKSSSRNR